LQNLPNLLQGRQRKKPRKTRPESSSGESFDLDVSSSSDDGQKPKKKRAKSLVVSKPIKTPRTAKKKLATTDKIALESRSVEPTDMDTSLSREENPPKKKRGRPPGVSKVPASKTTPKTTKKRAVLGTNRSASSSGESFDLDVSPASEDKDVPKKKGVKSVVGSKPPALKSPRGKIKPPEMGHASGKLTAHSVSRSGDIIDVVSDESGECVDMDLVEVKAARGVNRKSVGVSRRRTKRQETEDDVLSMAMSTLWGSSLSSRH